MLYILLLPRKGSSQGTSDIEYEALEYRYQSHPSIFHHPGYPCSKEDCADQGTFHAISG